jgi:hypothetical protein
MHHVCQFKGKVVLNVELDSKSDSGILNWIGSPLWYACLLGSLACTLCPIRPPHHFHDS